MLIQPIGFPFPGDASPYSSSFWMITDSPAGVRFRRPFSTCARYPKGFPISKYTEKSRSESAPAYCLPFVSERAIFSAFFAHAPLAQWIRATGFGPVGRRFESFRGHQTLTRKRKGRIRSVMHGPLVQLVEHQALNLGVGGSSPSRPTKDD